MIQANAELRFPLIEAALTPIGVIGGIRGVFFAGVGGAWFPDQKSANPCAGGGASNFKFLTNETQLCQVITGAQARRVRQPDSSSPIRSPDCNRRRSTMLRGRCTGFRLQDARASYGIGLETFALGFPIHFDWSWRTMFNKDWEDVVFSCSRPRAERRVRQRRRGIPEAALLGLDWIRFLRLEAVRL